MKEFLKKYNMVLFAAAAAAALLICTYACHNQKLGDALGVGFLFAGIIVNNIIIKLDKRAAK